MKPIQRPRSTLSVPANLYYQQSVFTDFVQGPIKKKTYLPKCPGSIIENPEECQKDHKDPATFTNRYKDICHSMRCQPLNMVKVLQSNISLEITCDRIKLLDILAILKTVQEDRSLHFICFKSKLKGLELQEHVDTEKKAKDVDKVLYTRYVVNRIAESLKDTVMFSGSLKSLKLQGIPFGGNSMHIFSQGLRNTESLQHLSLEQCAIRDEGCLQLCRGLRAVPTLLTLDLTSCKITDLGAEHIADLIKAQEIARFEQSWKQSLRYRTVNNDDMKGLRRVTLNDNPEIGDKGFKAILNVLLDDFWIRALDVQNCGITDVGAVLAMEMIKANNEIGVVDLRRNPFINNSFVTTIVKSVSEHMTPEKAEYGWLNIPKPKKVQSEIHSDKNSTISTHQWNRGPGKIRKAKSIAIIDQATKDSIMKVKDWDVIPESNKKNVSPEIVDYGCLQEHISPNNTDSSMDSLKTDSTDNSDESQVKLNDKSQINIPKQADDIVELFYNLINTPAEERVISEELR